LTMTVQKRNLFADSAVAPPAGDGTPGDYQDGKASAPISTRGALGDETAHGDLAGYRAKQAQYSQIECGGSPGMALPTGEGNDFSRTGEVPGGFDSNRTSTTTTGGTDHLVVRKGGADDQTDTGQSGGRTIA
jgi:hypothetical protein